MHVLLFFCYIGVPEFNSMFFFCSQSSMEGSQCRHGGFTRVLRRRINIEPTFSMDYNIKVVCVLLLGGDSKFIHCHFH